MSTDHAGAGASSGLLAAPFDLAAFARALTADDLGYQVSRYAERAEVRVTTDTLLTPPRLVSGTRAISTWLHECASGQRRSVITRLVDGGDRIAFTRHWCRPDASTGVSISTAELQDGRITTQHTILVQGEDASVPAAGWTSSYRSFLSLLSGTPYA